MQLHGYYNARQRPAFFPNMVSSITVLHRYGLKPLVWFSPLCRKPLNKAVRIVYAQGQDWKKELPKFLPNCVINNEVPANPNFHPVPAQEHAKAVRGYKTSCKKAPIKVGDIVLLKQPKENKFSTRFNPKPY